MMSAGLNSEQEISYEAVEQTPRKTKSEVTTAKPIGQDRIHSLSATLLQCSLSQDMATFLPPRSVCVPSDHLQKQSNNHSHFDRNDFSVKHTADGQNSASSSSIASTNSSARTSIIDFLKKPSQQSMDHQVRVNTPLSFRGGLDQQCNDNNLSTHDDQLVSKQLMNLFSPNSHRCNMSISIPNDDIDSHNLVRPIVGQNSSLTPRNQPHLLNSQQPSAINKIQLRLPSLIKQSPDSSSTPKQPNLHTHSNISPNQYISLKKVIAQAARKDTLSQKQQPISANRKLIQQQQSAIAKPMTPRQFTPSDPPLVITSRQLTHATPELNNVDDQTKNRSYQAERITLFATLKFQQIDVLRSNILSKEEVSDFFEEKTQKNRFLQQNQLSGFKEEESVVKSNKQLFLKSTQLVVTERNGLLNFREFKNLMKSFFQTIELKKQSSNKKKLVSIPTESTPSNPLFNNENKQKPIFIPQRIYRRELKSAQISRDKTPFDETEYNTKQQQPQGIVLESNYLVSKESQNYILKENQSNKQQHSQYLQNSQGRSQSPPKLRVAIPRLRSFSIQPEVKKYTSNQSNQSEKSQAGTYSSSNDISIGTNPLNSRSTPQAENETFDLQSGDGMFECTFQPHHFNQLNMQPDLESERTVFSQGMSVQQTSRTDIDDYPSLISNSFEQQSTFQLSDIQQHLCPGAETQRDLKQFNQSSRAEARSKSKYNSSIGITPMPKTNNNNNNKEVKVFKKPSFRKQPSFNEESSSTSIEKREALPKFDASMRADLSKKLFNNQFMNDTNDSLNSKGISGYDIQFCL